jgi:hypothetical protein
MRSTGFAPAEPPVDVPAGTDRHQQPERLAEVVPLRARELANSSSETPQDELASFAAIVRELELLDGRPLHGSGRNDCERAHATHPDGFRAAVDEARDANVGRRCGLLVSLVRQGWHVAADEIARAKAEAPAAPASLLEQRLSERGEA